MLTPEYGPRNRFGAILTTLELEPDPLYSGPALCDPEKCGICVKACTVGALSKYGEEPSNRGKIEGMELHYGKTDLIKCQIATQGMRKEFGGREDYVPSNDPTFEEFNAGLNKMPISPSGLQHIEAHNCGACLTYCPAGGWANRFKKTGLSNGYSSGNKEV